MTHRNAVTTAVKRISRTSERSGKEKAEMLNRKMFPKVFLILSENDEDVDCFLVPPAIMVLSVGDLLVAAISVEMSDSSDISSRSNVPVEVAKSWPSFYRSRFTRQPSASPFQSMYFLVVNHGLVRIDLHL